MGVASILASPIGRSGWAGLSGTGGVAVVKGVGPKWSNRSHWKGGAEMGSGWSGRGLKWEWPRGGSVWALEEWRVNGRGYKMWEGAGEWAWLPGVGGACLKGPSHLELLGQVAVVDFNQSFPGVETGGALRAAACFLPTATAL